MSRTLYDSDSSEDEESTYQETNVLLGYASTEATDDPISHLGGVPSWPNEDEHPSGALVRCKVCNDLMVLLLQLHGNLPDRFPGHERRLYLFTCKRKACRRKIGSIRGIRATRIAKGATARAAERSTRSDRAPEPAPAAPASRLGDAIFGVAPSGTASFAGNPFSNPSSGSAAPRNLFAAPSTGGSTPMNPFSSTSALAAKPPQVPDSEPANLTTSFAHALQISDPKPSPQSSPASNPSLSASKEPYPPQSEFPTPYPQFYLDADYETLSPEASPTLPANIPSSMDLDAADAGVGGSGDDANMFESSIDKAFQTFARRMAQNPEQVLRYEFGGTPVLYRKNDAVGQLFASTSQATGKIQVVGPEAPARVPKCENCSNARLFECQLTPHTITVLEEDDVSLDGMDWGSIIMAVCSKDCVPRGTDEGTTGFTEEWVGVQWEELLEK